MDDDSPPPQARGLDRRVLLAGGGAASLAALFGASAQAQERSLSDYGVILMHGKGGGPGGIIASLAEHLRAQGARVDMPRMGWAGARGRPTAYAIPYEQALQPIGGAIARMRAQGIRKIVLAGQSLGANAAIAWTVRHGASGLAGVIALAPGHTPERFRRPEIQRARDEARALVAAGQGERRRLFPDVNVGQTFDVEATARAWLSYFEPEGPANIPRNCARMPAMPLLWVIGRQDILHALGSAYAFDRAPRHAKSRYIVVEADHMETPDRARGEVTAWLRTL
jgi:pimeloyl-ACP methyl ester carboxylesterase